MANRKFKTSDFVLMGLISVIYGVIYLGAVYLGGFLTTFLSPSGLGILGYEPFYGIWFMAAITATFVIKKPGVALITEVIAALIEVLLGSMFGPIVIVSGIIQGLGVEIAFLIFGYENISFKTSILSAILCTIFTFLWTGFRSNYLALDMKIVIVIFIIRLVSSLFFTGFLAKVICDKLYSTGVLRER